MVRLPFFPNMAFSVGKQKIRKGENSDTDSDNELYMSLHDDTTH